MSNKQEILYGLGAIALALQITAISTNFWSVKSQKVNEAKISGTVTGNFGLWKLCVDSSARNSELEGCIHLPIEGDKKFPKNSLYAARVFAVTGAILTFLGLVMMMYFKGFKKSQLMLMLVGAIFSLVGTFVWAAELKDLTILDFKAKFDLGWSWYVSLASGLAGLFASAYFYYGK